MKPMLILAEKPSMATEIAAALADLAGEKPSKEKVFWRVGQHKVAWLVGHLFELCAPQDYGSQYCSGWKMDLLPIVPETFRRKARKDREGHVAALQKLIRECHGVIVNAGDAGREGQLLVDEMLYETKVDPFAPNVQRLWVKSLARADLLAALKGLIANAEKRGLSAAAESRQKADWIFGINLTQLYTLRGRAIGHDALLSVGRVQTPTLRLVVDRDLEIENFKPHDYFVPIIKLRHANGEFEAKWVPAKTDTPAFDPEGRLVSQGEAERVRAAVDGGQAEIVNYITKEKQKAAPLPFSLSSLQKLCSARFGLTAQQTLDVAQSLYERHKVTTYPRTDSNYLPTAIYTEQAATILDVLIRGQFNQFSGNVDPAVKSGAWNDAKVSDHHGIIPTLEATPDRLSKLSEVEAKVFAVIAKRFLAQFAQPYRYISQSAICRAGGERFDGQGRQVLDYGWMRIEGRDKDQEDETEAPALPKMEPGDGAAVIEARVDVKKTQPPSYFTDGTLIDAMTSIHRFVQDPEVRKRLKESEGIGTEATRANIIETLVKRNFLERRKRQLRSTDSGRRHIQELPGAVTDPGMTALWESALESIVHGDVVPDTFLNGVVHTVTAHVNRVKTTLPDDIANAPKPSGPECPSCKEGVLVKKLAKGDNGKPREFLSCSRYPECKYAESGKKPTKPLEGDGSDCPSCGQGKMRTRVARSGASKGKKFLACDRYPDCSYVARDEKSKPGGFRKRRGRSRQSTAAAD